ncbi:MAG: hypothetical protein GWN58_19515 [Anaerolineae bacterium]|nr:hypothetical protein [Anaerolineae bacterium]
MPSYYWIKMYHEVLHDPKMGRLSDHLWRRFFELCLIAGEADNEGWLPPVGDMAWTLRTTPGDLETDLLLLLEYQLVTQDGDGVWFVTKFADRQAPLSDAERKRRQRERDKKVSYYGHAPVTPDVTNCDTDTDTDTESEQSRSDAESESDPPPAVVAALESIEMGQIPTVIQEALTARLTPEQIIETCAWARENDKGAALVRSMFREGDSRRPRAPDNDDPKWWVGGQYESLVES